MVLYSDFNSFNAIWLQNLILNHEISNGKLDKRDIKLLTFNDVYHFNRVHLFAGIGGWERALNILGWPIELSVWTGSCPCQPFSNLGLKRGINDHRDEWKEMYRLIKVCKPPIIFGEQVASKLGRLWLSRIQVDLEKAGYIFGSANLPAASVGAPHKRERLYWGATLADSYDSRYEEIQRKIPTSIHRRISTEWAWNRSQSGNTIMCRAGKTRRIKPGITPLVDGVPNHMEIIHAYGNSIVPQIAAIFILSFIEAMAILNAS